MSPEEILHASGIEIPAPSPAVANYVRAVRVGSLLFVSGHGPMKDGKAAIVGKLGADLGIDDGRKAAELVTINILATLKAELGELSRVKRIVKLLVMVNATPEFTEHPKVADGSTDLLVKVFGEAGRPARSAVGMSSLPFNIAVEIEGVVEVEA
jgi:enamine deaminase RidA (YjgF/YER057c/UK114 family)